MEENPSLPPAPEETPDADRAFPRLSADQIRLLSSHGERRQVARDEVLFREGDVGYDFHVVLAGKAAVLTGEDRRLIAVHGPGRFLGELSLLTGQAAFFTAVMAEPGEVLVVPADRLRELATADRDLGDVVLGAFLLRRELLIGLGAGLQIVGSRFAPDTRRLREFAARNRVPHRFVDLEEDDGAEALLRGVGVTHEETPVVIWRGQVLRNPSNMELGELLGLRAASPHEADYDLIVVGAGPAGLAAAVYGASEGLDTIAIDAVATGGQAGTSSQIENYLGFPAGISGSELAERAVLQAEKFGAEISVPADATSLEARGDHYVVGFADGGSASGRSVAIVCGVQYRRLPIPRLAEFESSCVYYAATLMEAQMCQADPVVVVGGGNSAGQAALFLSQHVASVALVLREDDLRRHMSNYLADRLEHTARVEILPHSEIKELIGEGQLQAVVVEDCWSEERREVEARDLFIFVGAEPHTAWLGGELALDEKGFILTGSEAARAVGDGRAPLMFETSRPGVFAAGDVRSGSIKRVASAVGEGSMTVRLVHDHLGSHHRQRAEAPRDPGLTAQSGSTSP